MTRDEFMDVVYDELHSDGDNNRANRIIDAADDYVDEYAPHWIPVAERLPEENGEYLCQEKQGFLYVDTWNGEYWECADGALGIVTAWMPLPESYKEDTK